MNQVIPTSASKPGMAFGSRAPDWQSIFYCRAHLFCTFPGRLIEHPLHALRATRAISSWIGLTLPDAL
ncbi:MAG: hypothetical protein QF886_19125 [Planctomycetota bacterium]|nr:hypothetical protein [Planctomycetota bacterium]